jgi:Polyketide cyclase / dehydrase and lipid transport
MLNASKLSFLVFVSGVLAPCACGYEIQHLQADRVGKRFAISLAVHIDRPIDEVFHRLTDFNHLTHLSGSIEESRQLRPDEAGDVIVYTRMHPCVLFMCRTVRIFEAVTFPEKYQVLANVIPARSDLAYGKSLWTLSVQGDGTLLHYQSEIEPGFDMFPVIGPAAAKYSLKKQAKAFLQGLEEK